MVAAVQAPDRRVVAIQRTFLDPGGDGKADVSTPKKGLGRYHGGAVRLAPEGECLGLAEGIEDALSAMQLSGVGCWATAGAGRMASVQLPPQVREVHLFANADAPGQEGADKAAKVFSRQGRRVVLHTPPAPANDWNDLLRGALSEVAK